MNKRKKGFTLIELLAVIVILAIILLIATPIILNVIEDAKKGAFKNSANYLVSTSEQEYMLKVLNNESLTDLVYTYENGTVVGGVDLNYRGEKPKNGTIVIREDGKIGMAIDNGTWCAKKEYNSDNVILTKLSETECILSDVPEVVNSFNEDKGVNKPVLSSGMTPIKWDENNVETETTEDDSEWYAYSEKKWANVKTEDGSYWVWIPRYAYKITSGFHESETGTIDVKFLKGKTNETTDATTIETNGYEVEVKDTSMHYFLHPAFHFDGEELGFWVAKFEPTAAEGVDTITGTCNANDNVTTKTVKVVPNSTSWRCITISIAYDVSLSMKEKTDIYGWNINEVNTHMMKNSEWGAVAYLSKSVYGADTEEIWNNSYNQYRAGCSGPSVSASNQNTCVEYNTENGEKASTTHNIYGVYDMSSGAWERVMGNYNNLEGISDFTEEDILNIDSKYMTKYYTSTEILLNGVGMDYDNFIYGDAMYETSNNAARYNGSVREGTSAGTWFQDYSYLPYTSYPWFNRGGYFSRGSDSGIFAFGDNHGGTNAAHTFRPVVFVK